MVDFSEEQLKKDQEEAVKHSLSIKTVKADKRELSAFNGDRFLTAWVWGLLVDEIITEIKSDRKGWWFPELAMV